MKSIVLLSQKGGSGKTTLAVHLSVVASTSNLNVALIDTDPASFRLGMGAYAERQIALSSPQHERETSKRFSKRRKTIK